VSEKEIVISDKGEQMSRINKIFDIKEKESFKDRWLRGWNQSGMGFFCAGNFLDLITTIMFISVLGVGAEGNPLARYLFSLGIFWASLFKIGLAVVIGPIIPNWGKWFWGFAFFSVACWNTYNLWNFMDYTLRIFASSVIR